MENKQNFDFSRPVEFDKLDVGSNLEAESIPSPNIEKNTTKRASNPKKNYNVLVIVFILLASLIAVGVFSIMQTLRIQELEGNLHGSEVAGASGTSPEENIIVGNGFSIVINQKTPEGFALETSFGPVEYLDRSAATTTFLAKKDKGGVELLTGLEVDVIEYDNKMKEEDFVSKVEDFLGGDYVSSEQKIKVSDRFELTQFNPQSEDDPVYYATVTAQNYHVIRVYSQTAKYTDFVEYSRFTDQLVPGLWLN